MPLTRYQIRNEYGLADPELYRDADKDDPEALYEGIAMAGLVGVLRQLGDLAEFAAVIFHDLHEEVMVTAARGHGLMLRAQQLEAEVPSIEKAFLSQTNHSLFLLNAGVDWHPNLRMDENLITREDLPRCVLDFYEECRGPPRLFLLEKFDVAGAGACLKRYSDPSFFKAKFTSSETMGADIQRERKARKVKKKRSCWRNGENREVYPTSHSKLHQLLSEERNSENNVLMHHVKLKKRQLNGFPSESTTGKSYMERFVETNSSDSKISYKDTLVLPQLNIESCNTSEQGLEIREISTASPASKLLQRERGLHSSGERHETPLEQSMYDLHEDVIKEGILKKLHEPTCDIVVGKVPSRLYKLKDRNELMVVVESQKEASVDGYQSDDTTSEVDNYMDALASIESEMEMDTGSRPHNDRGFFNTMRLGIDSDTKEQQKHQDQFSDSHSIGNSSKSDDENNLFNRGRYNPSKMDTLSNLAVKGPLGRDAVAEIASSAGTCSTEIEDVSSEKPTSNVDTSVTETLEYVVPSGSCIEVSEMPRSGSELVEASPDFCVTDSNSAVSHLSPGDNLYEFQLEGPDFVGFEGPSSNTEEDTENLCIDVPCTTNLSDSAIKMKDDALAEEFVRRQQVEVMDGLTLELSSDALLHRSDISGLVVARKDNGGTLDTKCAEDGPTENMNRNNDSPHSVTLPTEEQLSCLEGQDVKVCSSTRRPECLPASTNTDDLDDLKSGRTLETDTEIQTTREKPKYLTSALGIQKTGDFSKQDLSEMTEEVPPPQMDLRVGSGSSGGKTLYNNLVVSSNTPDCGVSDEPTPDVIQSNSCGSVGKGTAASSEFPSLYLTPESTNAASVTDYYSQTDSLSDTVHAEADADSVMYRKLIGSSNCTKLQEECLPCSRDLGGLVSEVHAQLDDMEPVRVHAEAADEDTAVFGRLIGSPSRNHVKLEDECPATDGNVSDIENKVHSKLDNLTTGAAHTEADDADTADCPNLIGSSLKIQMKLQEECLSDACSEWCKLETIEARNPKFIIGEGAQIERNQLAVASTDLNVEVYDSESHGPSSSELLYDVQHAQSHLHLRNVTVVPQSSVEMDNLLQFVHQSRPSEHSEAPMCNSLSNQEQRIPSEQALVLEAGQLIVESLHGEGESLLLSNILDEQTQSLDGRDQNCCDSVPPEISLVEKTEPVKHGDMDGSSGGAPEFSCIDPLKQHPETDFPLVPTSHNMVTCGPTIDSLASSFPSFGMLSGTTHEQSSKPQPSQGPNATQAYVEAPPLPPLPPLQWRVGKFRDSSLTAEGEMVQSSLNPFLPLGFTLLGGEIVQPLSPIVPQNSTGVGEHQHGSKALGRDVVHPDLNSFSSQLPAVVGDANNKQGSQTSDIEETQLPNPFLPLPATEDEKHEHELIPLGEEKSQPNLNSFASSPATEEVKATFDTLQGESCDLQNLSGPEPKMNDGTMKDEEPLNSFAPPIIKEEESLNSFAPPTIKEEEPLNSFAPPYIKHEEPASLTLEGEMPSNASTSFPNAKVGVPNGKPPKQPRPRDPLIEAVASHDRSMLRKATERVRPQIVQKMDERGSLLDQIRTKSFSLKPVVRPMLATRPSVQGPRTNLKIAAILEKANSIRQATAGSDEDDDSWSDS